MFRVSGFRSFVLSLVQSAKSRAEKKKFQSFRVSCFAFRVFEFGGFGFGVSEFCVFRFGILFLVE